MRSPNSAQLEPSTVAGHPAHGTLRIWSTGFGVPGMDTLDGEIQFSMATPEGNMAVARLVDGGDALEYRGPIEHLIPGTPHFGTAEILVATITAERGQPLRFTARPVRIEDGE